MSANTGKTKEGQKYRAVPDFKPSPEVKPVSPNEQALDRLEGEMKLLETAVTQLFDAGDRVLRPVNKTAEPGESIPEETGSAQTDRIRSLITVVQSQRGRINDFTIRLDV